MAGSSSGTSGEVGGNAATMNMILGVFLKLLAFFVILFSYTDLQPVKVQKAEDSLTRQFGINLHLVEMLQGPDAARTNPIPQKGQAYENMAQNLRSQFDFLGSENITSGEDMIIRVPADMVLTLDGQEPASPDFAMSLVAAMQEARKQPNGFDVFIKTSGPNDAELMRQTGNFVQEIVSFGYAQKLLTIGYEKKADAPQIEIHIHYRNVT